MERQFSKMLFVFALFLISSGILLFSYIYHRYLSFIDRNSKITKLIIFSYNISDLMVQAKSKSCNQASDCVNTCGTGLLPACLNHVCVCVHTQKKLKENNYNEYSLI